MIYCIGIYSHVFIILLCQTSLPIILLCPTSLLIILLCLTSLPIILLCPTSLPIIYCVQYHFRLFIVSNITSDYFIVSVGQEDHFDILTEMMPVASTWKAIGRGLRIEPGRLEMISQNNSGKPKECLLEMLTCWLNRNYNVERFGEPTWRAVVKVVAHPAAGDNCALALSIAGKHSGNN